MNCSHLKSTAALMLALILAAVPARGPGAEEVRSPDGRILVKVDANAGLLTWQVSYDGERLIGPGTLGLELAGENLRPQFAIERVQRSSGDSTWHPVWGNWSTVRDRYHELLLTFAEAGGPGRKLQAMLRVYDEGIGLRYIVPEQPGAREVTIKKRLTEYRFAENRPVYQNRKYEYGTAGITNMSRSEGCVTIDAGAGRFISLMDADRAGFSETAWESGARGEPVVVGSLRSPAKGTLPFNTSWEAMIIAENAASLYERSFLIDNLNPPCAIKDTSWIRSGQAITQVRNTRMVTSELKGLMEFASAHNMEHVEIDHSWCGAETKWTPAEIALFETNKFAFWKDKPEWRQNVGGNVLAPAKGWVPFRPRPDTGGNFVDLDVATLTTHGQRLLPPVGLFLYLRAAVIQEFGGEQPAEKIFATYRGWGVAGVKLGFVPSGSQKNEAVIADLVKKAAEHKLMLVIHDAYLPSGLSRTYPNLVNVEGVAGEEAEPSIAAEMKSRHDVMLPFTRCLMGPVDYTPEMFKPSKTHAHQVAMVGIYPGRVSIRGGMKQWFPGGVGGGEIEFVDKLPALFDEMRVTTDLGKHVTVARRRGDIWFIASMCDGQPRSFQVPMNFLQRGATYNASIYADGPGGPQTTHARQPLTSESVVKIEMQGNGGHLMILEPTGTPAK